VRGIGLGFAAGFAATLFLCSRVFATDLPFKAPVLERTNSADSKYYLVYSQDLRYVTWDGTRGYRPDAVPRNTNPGSGHQLYMPMAAQIFGQPSNLWSYDILMRGGYVDSKQTTSGQSGRYSGTIDTILSGKVLYRGNSLFTPFFSLSMNLPTGTSNIGRANQSARMDPDIVDVATFGEGFNIGPTAGVIIPVESMRTTFTVAAGHTSRGSYDRDDPVAPARFVSPGDETTALVRFHTTTGPLTVTGGLSYAWSGTTEVTSQFGFVTVRPGDRISLNANAGYIWSKNWQTVAGFGWTHLGSNAFTTSAVAPTPLQPGNDNGDILRATLGQFYFTGPWTFGLNGLYLKRSSNEFIPSLVEFVPAKSKYQLEGIASYRPLPNLRIDGRVARIWTTEDARSDWVFPGVPFAFPGTGVPEIKQDAWSFTLSGGIGFDPQALVR